MMERSIVPPVDRARCTSFPNLYLRRSDRQDVERVQRMYAVDIASPAVEELTFAWAALLISYAGTAEDPVFWVDEEAVRVVCSDRVVEPIQVEETDLDSICRSGIVTEKGDPSHLSLYVRLTRGGACQLVSQRDIVPIEHLPCLAAELAVRVRRAREHSNQPIRWPVESGLALSVLNASPKIVEGLHLLHHLFEAQAAKNQTALEYLDNSGERRSYSYREINNLSEQLASKLGRALHANGNADQHVVPTLIPQSPALYVAILAALKSGAAFCPLDAEAPIERLQFIVADLSAKVVLADRASAGKVTWDGGPEVMVVRTENAELNGYQESTLQRAEAKASDLAYVMYTSGSTGTPKGVGVPHSAVTQSLLAHERHIPDFCRFLQFAAPTFDVFVFEMFFPFFRGKTLVSSDRGSLLNDLPSIINRMHVDASVLTPTVVGGLLQKRENVPGLRVLMTIGEMLTRPIIDEFGDSPGRPGMLYAMYGPTEAAIHCTIASNLSAYSKVGIIGQPLDTVSAYVVAPPSDNASANTSFEILPAGHVGELAVGGHQLASGYINRPEQTAAAFVTTKEHGRVYRTGDKARLLPNGMLECLGRLVADQVKLRGHRLELGEIERVAAGTWGVRHAVASIVDGVLVVFCLATDERVTAASVYDSCRRWLPAPIIPEDILLIKEIPRLPSGKADKKALEAEYRRRSEQAKGQADDSHAVQGEKSANGSWSQEEQKIRMVLARLANLDESRIGRNATIFQMGLDSVKAVKIAADLREQGFNVFAADVLQNTSIASLVKFVRASEDRGKSELPIYDFATFDRSQRSVLISRLEIPALMLQAVRPCTPTQSGMIAGFINSEGSLYLSHILMRFHHAVSLHRLEEAWNAVSAKYMMLRTGFASVKDQLHSFAMLEYKDVAKAIPWQEIGSSSSLIETVEQQREWARRRILQDLHEPAWQLSVLRENGNVFLQFSALHALFDAQSLRQMLQDVARAYGGQTLAPEAPIEPVLSAILTSSSANLDAHRQFWEGLGPVLPSTEFPNLSPVRSTGGSSLERSIRSSWTGRRLEDECARRGVTVAAAGQAAWARLLSAYVGQGTVAFGVVLSARTIMDAAAQLAFPCVTTLPVGCDVESSNLELLERVMKLNSDIMQHQHVPLRRVNQWIRRDKRPIFNTIFAYQKHSSDAFDDTSVWEIVDENLRVDYAISVEIEILSDDQVALRLTFEEDVCPPEQAELLLNQLDDVLIDTITNPSKPCTDFSAVSAPLVSRTRAKEGLIPSRTHLLHGFVEHHASITPGKVALEYVEDISGPSTTRSQWTYAELNAEGDRVCDLVLRQGLQPGDLVAICFEKCPEASFAILGILKAGCGYVALDPDAPVARRQFILDDSGAKLLLTLERQRPGLTEMTGITVIAIDRGMVQARPGSDILRPVKPLHPESICYCLYTSGTTGTPKGCEITHENVVQAMLAFQRLFAGRWNDESRFLQFASYHFDVSVLEQFWSWSVGICVISAPRDFILSDIPSAIQELGITHLDLTPSLARTLHPDDAPGLHDGVFITGGELLKQDIIDAWGPYRCIHNAYGPTEASIGVTMNPRVPANAKPSNIGAQFDNVGTYVLGPGTDVPVLRGAIGELCVSGPLVGRGYRNRQELTNQRFQYLEKFEERIYRTGDLVRILHNGDFDYVGRIDHQVKLRGQRLELAEVNEVIKKGVAEVSEVASLVLKHQMFQSEQLVCFVGLHDGQLPGASPSIQWSPESASLIKSIRDVCRAKLPGYGVPTHILPLTHIPLSVNHKVDLNQLEQIYQSTTLNELQRLSHLSKSSEGGWSAAEREVVQVLANFLGADGEEITKDANIFELGLDSISVIELANLLRQEGFTGAKPSLIMQNAIMENLAKAITKTKGQSASTPKPSTIRRQELLAFSQRHSYTVARNLGISHESVDVVLPCTPLQEGMLTASMTSEDALYFNVFYFELPPSIELARLRDAWVKLAYRCDVLRLCFCATNDGFAQVFRKPSEPRIVELDVSSEEMFPTVKKSRFDKWSSQDVSAFKEPLRILLLRAPSKLLMAVQIFHALYDGISFQLMMQRLSGEYHNIEGLDYGPLYQDVLPLGPLCAPERAKEFWLHHLDGAQPSHMPSTAPSSATEEYELVMNLDCLSEIDAARRRLNVTYKSLFQASWMSVLRKFFQDNVTVGMVISGRSVDLEGAELTIGPLFNTLPFFLRFDDSDTWDSIARKCHDFNIASLPYQHTPLRHILKWCNRPKDQPLFDTLFVFDRDLARDADDVPDMFSLVESKSRAEYPLAIEIRLQQDGKILITLVAQRTALDKPDASSLLDDLNDNLRQLISNPYAKLKRTARKQNQAPDGFQTSITKEGSAMRNMDGGKDFRWSHEASHIRSELSALASVSDSAIDEHTSIFDLGLDSIDAIKLSSRLRQHGIKLTVGDIMQNLTISALMDRLSKEPEPRVNGPDLHSLGESRNTLRRYLASRSNQAHDIEDVLPTTGLQEAMIAKMVGSEGSYYLNHEILKLSPAVDHLRLMEAWDVVIQCTPILRTSFVDVDDPEIPYAYAQIVHRPTKLLWESTTLPADKSLEEAISVVKARSAGDVLEKPPLNLTLIHHRGERYVLFSIAHALYDGWSLYLLHEDVKRAYHDIYMSRPSYEPGLELMLQSSSQAALGFWKSQLSGIQGTKFPPRHVDVGGERKVRHYREYQSKVSAQSIQDFCRAHRVTLQGLAHTCWSFVLASYVGALELVFGAVLAGRDFENADEILFPTMNTVPIRSIIHGTRREMVAYMTELNTRLTPFQHCSLRAIQAAAELEGQELFNALFIVQRLPESTTRNGDKLYEPVLGESETEYPMCVEMEVIGDGLVWRAASHDALLDSQGLLGLLDKLDFVLDSVITSPDAPAVEFTAHGTSTCGLSPFTASPQVNGDGPHSYKPGHGSPTYSGEWSELESSIRQVLSLVAKIPESEIRKDQSAYHLGLDSISAIKVSNLLKKRSIKLSVRDLLQATSIQDMALQAMEKSELNGQTEVDYQGVLKARIEALDLSSFYSCSGLESDNVERVIPASPGQVFLLSIWQKTRGTVFYSSFRYEAGSRLDAQRLDKAWTALLDQSPILRSVFAATGQSEVPLVQVVLKQSNNPILWTHTEDQTECSEDTSALAPGVQLRVCLQSSATLLEFRVLHAYYDAVSLPLIVSHLQSLYNELDMEITPRPQLDEFLAHNTVSSDTSQRRGFWTQYLGSPYQYRASNSRPLSIQKNVTRTEVFCSVSIPASDLQTWARVNGLSFQSLFLAAYATTLKASLSRTGKSTDDDTVIFGIYLANRSHPTLDLSMLAAPTLNFVPLKVQGLKDNDLKDVAEQIQRDLHVISTPQNSAVSLWEIDEWTGLKLDTFVNFLKLPDNEPDSNPRTDESKSTVTFEPLISEAQQPRRKTITLQTEDFQEPATLKQNAVKDSYLPPVEVEAKLRDNALDIGVFGPTEMVSLEDADYLIQGIESELLRVLEPAA